MHTSTQRKYGEALPGSFGSLDIGPTGFRLYALVPARVSGDDIKFIAWDIEVLNYKLKSALNS